jgi:hypothetical protein
MMKPNMTASISQATVSEAGISTLDAPDRPRRLGRVQAQGSLSR